jgi:hypothetical protein
MIDRPYRPTLFEIILGRHAYSMEPEEETAWCRAFLVMGFVAGILFCGLVSDFMGRLLHG